MTQDPLSIPAGLLEGHCFPYPSLQTPNPPFRTQFFRPQILLLNTPTASKVLKMDSSTIRGKLLPSMKGRAELAR